MIGVYDVFLEDLHWSICQESLGNADLNETI